MPVRTECLVPTQGHPKMEQGPQGSDLGPHWRHPDSDSQAFFSPPPEITLPSPPGWPWPLSQTLCFLGTRTQGCLRGPGPHHCILCLGGPTSSPIPSLREGSQDQPGQPSPSVRVGGGLLPSSPLCLWGGPPWTLLGFHCGPRLWQHLGPGGDGRTLAPCPHPILNLINPTKASGPLHWEAGHKELERA